MLVVRLQAEGLFLREEARFLLLAEAYIPQATEQKFAVPAAESAVLALALFLQSGLDLLAAYIHCSFAEKETRQESAARPLAYPLEAYIAVAASFLFAASCLQETFLAHFDSAMQANLPAVADLQAILLLAAAFRQAASLRAATLFPAAASFYFLPLAAQALARLPAAILNTHPHGPRNMIRIPASRDTLQARPAASSARLFPFVEVVLEALNYFP